MDQMAYVVVVEDGNTKEVLVTYKTRMGSLTIGRVRKALSENGYKVQGILNVEVMKRKDLFQELLDTGEIPHIVTS